MKAIFNISLAFILMAFCSHLDAQTTQKIEISTTTKQVVINGTVITSKSKLDAYTTALGSSDRVEKKAKQVNYVYDSLGIVLETTEGSADVLMRVFVGGAATVKEPLKSFSGVISINNAKIQSTQTLAQIQAKTTGMKWVETSGVGMIWKDKSFSIGIDAKGGKASRVYFSFN